MNIYKQDTDLLYCTSESGSDLAVNKVRFNPYNKSRYQKPYLDIVISIDSLLERRNNLINLVLTYRDIIKLKDHLSSVIRQIDTQAATNKDLKERIDTSLNGEDYVPPHLKERPKKQSSNNK